ncbi:MAG: fumarate reductase iron-sulfur subunit [Chloroflexota bacterium]|jgi:fumarate reductase iron-sulfur subunit|nr:fumarate reductase iron-sulfur subunit [Chloroflexota bacterium]
MAASNGVGAAHSVDLSAVSSVADMIKMTVTRYRPGDDPVPVTESFFIPYHDDWVVLDALQYIKDYVDGSLSFRWSCHMGVCGSCGMIVNGTPKLTCAAFLRDYYPHEVVVQPLTNFPVVRDLVVDIEDFIHKLEEVKPYIIRDDLAAAPVGLGNEYRQLPEQVEDYKQFSMCINCMLCYSACPVYGMEPTFLGPAAIALGHRYNMDSRDQGRNVRMPLLGSSEGVWECTFVGECSVVCPKNVDPAAAIQRTKLATTNDMMKSILMPWSKR